MITEATGPSRQRRGDRGCPVKFEEPDKAGYAAMRRHVASYRERVWAVEGSNGAGRPLAQRLLADGEHVVDVPAKVSARVRLLYTGHTRKTVPNDAHEVSVVAVRTK